MKIPIVDQLPNYNTNEEIIFTLVNGEKEMGLFGGVTEDGVRITDFDNDLIAEIPIEEISEWEYFSDYIKPYFRKYKYIVAWGRLMLSHNSYIVNQVLKAENSNAPLTATYFTSPSKTWYTLEDITREGLVAELNSLIPDLL